MENRYFTPDIEDIHVGYELVSNLEKLGLGIGRVPLRISKDNILNVLSNIDNYEVPYLTKEQIEAEGWNETSKYNYAKIDSNITAYYGNDHYLWITHPAKTILGENYLANSFKGECKDINTFRKICKLLGI